MATQTIQELGLSTLDQRIAPARPYTDYWSTTYPEAASKVTELSDTDRDRLQQFGTFITGCTQVIRGEAKVNPAPNASRYMSADNRSSTTLVSLWDKGLGSLNGLSDAAAEDLLQGASLVLAERLRTAPRVVGQHGDDERIANFQALWMHAKDGPKRSAPSLLLSAGLTYKAALVESKTVPRNILMDCAASMYQGVANDPNAVPFVKEQANNHLHDIQFHKGMQAYREALSVGDEKQIRAVDKQLQGIMANQAADFHALYSALYSADAPAARTQLVGRAFEQFVPLILRDRVLSDAQGTLAQFEVRHSFTHEDEQPEGLSKLRPKAGFDLVIRHHETDGSISTLPVQLKLVEGIKKSPTSGKDEYLPGIAYVRVADLLPESMKTVAAELVAKYRNFDLDRPASPELRNAQERLPELFRTA